MSSLQVATKMKPYTHSVAKNLLMSKASGLEAKSFFVRMIGDAIPCTWGAVNSFLKDAFGTEIQLVSSIDDAFSVSEERSRFTGVCILGAETLELLSSNCDYISGLNHQWALVVIQPDSTFGWCAPRNEARIVGSFSSTAPSSAILPKFVSIIFELAMLTSEEGALERERGQAALTSQPKSSVSTGLNKAEGENAAGFAKNLLIARREIFAWASVEPYLSILLQLACAKSEGESVDMTALGADLRIPPSTLTRKVDYLVDKGLVVRFINEDDRRRVFLEPTLTAIEMVTTYLDHIKSYK